MQRYKASIKLIGLLLFIAALGFLVFSFTSNTLPIK